MDTVCRNSQIADAGCDGLNMRLHPLPHSNKLQEVSTVPADSLCEGVVAR